MLAVTSDNGPDFFDKGPSASKLKEYNNLINFYIAMRVLFKFS